MSDLICIEVCLGRPQAQIIKNLLESQDIKTIISVDDCAGLNPHLAFITGGVKILVNKNDAERARRILEKTDK